MFPMNPIRDTTEIITPTSQNSTLEFNSDISLIFLTYISYNSDLFPLTSHFLYSWNHSHISIFQFLAHLPPSSSLHHYSLTDQNQLLYSTIFIRQTAVQRNHSHHNHSLWNNTEMIPNTHFDCILLFKSLCSFPQATIIDHCLQFFSHQSLQCRFKL